MRSRRHRWLAPWLVMLLLFNQLALAQHVCGLGEAMPMTADYAAAHAHCDASREASGAVTADQLACRMHCDDLPKIAKDPVNLQVPALPAAGFADTDTALLAPSPPAFIRVLDSGTSHRRRLHEFCVLLI